MDQNAAEVRKYAKVWVTSIVRIKKQNYEDIVMTNVKRKSGTLCNLNPKINELLQPPSVWIQKHSHCGNGIDNYDSKSDFSSVVLVQNMTEIVLTYLNAKSAQQQR